MGWFSNLVLFLERLNDQSLFPTIYCSFCILIFMQQVFSTNSSFFTFQPLTLDSRRSQSSSITYLHWCPHAPPRAYSLTRGTFRARLRHESSWTWKVCNSFFLSFTVYRHACVSSVYEGKNLNIFRIVQLFRPHVLHLRTKIPNVYLFITIIRYEGLFSKYDEDTDGFITAQAWWLKS